MNVAQENAGRYQSAGHSRRHSEAVPDVSIQAPGTPRTGSTRPVKRYKRLHADIPQHYQTAPSSSNYGAPSFTRSNSSGSMKRPLSFIAGIASKVKNAIEGWQDSAANRNSGRFNYNGVDFDSNSDSSPNIPKKPFESHPRVRRTSDRLSVPQDRQIQCTKRVARKSYSSGSYNTNPSFAEVMEILSVPSSPELERCFALKPNSRVASFVGDDNLKDYDVAEEPSCETIKACDLTKCDGDINILVIGSEGVGKSALIVRYLTKRFIGEYASNVESIYDHMISIDGKDAMIHVWDSGIPQMLQKSSESEMEKLDMFSLSEILSLTSLNSPVRNSSSSTSSAYDNRISSSSFEEDLAMTASSSRLDEQFEKKSAAKRKKKSKNEVNNNCNNKKKNEMQLRLNWSDCIIVIYSVCDTESFEAARDLIRYIRGQTVRGHKVSDVQKSAKGNTFNSNDSPSSDHAPKSPQIPIILVGNKADLQHRRRVKAATAVTFSQGYNCTAIELSVSEGYEAVSKVFNDVIESIYREKFPSRLTKIKSIVRTVSGGFTHKRNLSM